MNKYLFMIYFLAVAFFFSLLSGCAKAPPAAPVNTAPVTEPTETLPATTKEEPKPVEQVGTVPESLSRVVEKNLFHDSVASGGRILIM